MKESTNPVLPGLLMPQSLADQTRAENVQPDLPAVHLKFFSNLVSLEVDVVEGRRPEFTLPESDRSLLVPSLEAAATALHASLQAIQSTTNSSTQAQATTLASTTSQNGNSPLRPLHHQSTTSTLPKVAQFDPVLLQKSDHLLQAEARLRLEREQKNAFTETFMEKRRQNIEHALRNSAQTKGENSSGKEDGQDDLSLWIGPNKFNGDRVLETAWGIAKPISGTEAGVEKINQSDSSSFGDGYYSSKDNSLSSEHTAPLRLDVAASALSEAPLEALSSRDRVSGLGPRNVTAPVGAQENTVAPVVRANHHTAPVGAQENIVAPVVRANHHTAPLDGHNRFTAPVNRHHRNDRVPSFNFDGSTDDVDPDPADAAVPVYWANDIAPIDAPTSDPNTLLARLVADVQRNPPLQSSNVNGATDDVEDAPMDVDSESSYEPPEPGSFAIKMSENDPQFRQPFSFYSASPPGPGASAIRHDEGVTFNRESSSYSPPPARTPLATALEAPQDQPRKRKRSKLNDSASDAASPIPKREPMSPVAPNSYQMVVPGRNGTPNFVQLPRTYDSSNDWRTFEDEDAELRAFYRAAGGISAPELEALLPGPAQSSQASYGTSAPQSQLLHPGPAQSSQASYGISTPQSQLLLPGPAQPSQASYGISAPQSQPLLSGLAQSSQASYGIAAPQPQLLLPGPTQSSQAFLLSLDDSRLMQLDGIEYVAIPTGREQHAGLSGGFSSSQGYSAQQHILPPPPLTSFNAGYSGLSLTSRTQMPTPRVISRAQSQAYEQAVQGPQIPTIGATRTRLERLEILDAYVRETQAQERETRRREDYRQVMDARQVTDARPATYHHQAMDRHAMEAQIRESQARDTEANVPLLQDMINILFPSGDQYPARNAGRRDL